MAGLNIYWTKTAIAQRDYTFEYWNNRNKSKIYSSKLNKAIKERVSLLKTHPELGKPTSFPNTKTISLGHYSIIYKISENNIFITGFWDNRQNPVKLLKFLKEKN